MKPLRDQLNANERKISKFTGSTSNKSYNTKPKLKTKLARLRLSTISPLLDICTDLIKIEARKNGNIDANNNITNNRINRSVTHQQKRELTISGGKIKGIESSKEKDNSTYNNKKKL